MTNMEALKAIFTANGGTAEEAATFTRLLDALKGIFEAKGGTAEEASTFAKLSDALEGISEHAGGGGDASVLVCAYDDGYLDKTWQEIADALTAGKVVLEHGAYLSHRVSKTTHDDDGYWVWIYTDGLGQESQSFWCEGPNDYPNDD